MVVILASSRVWTISIVKMVAEEAARAEVVNN